MNILGSSFYLWLLTGGSFVLLGLILMMLVGSWHGNRRGSAKVPILPFVWAAVLAAFLALGLAARLSVTWLGASHWVDALGRVLSGIGIGLFILSAVAVAIVAVCQRWRR